MWNSVMNVTVTHFINPHLFWFRVNGAPEPSDPDESVQSIESMLTSMYYDGVLGIADKLCIGETVGVNFLPWNRCIRADVICLQRMPDNNMDYILWAHDHGFPLCSALDEIRILPNSYLPSSSSIYRGGIDALQPAEKRVLETSSTEFTMQHLSEWQKDACTKLEELLQNAKRIDMKKSFLQNGKVWGQLKVMRLDGSVVNAGEFLIASQMAVRDGKTFRQKVGTLRTTKILPWLTNDGSKLYQMNYIGSQCEEEAKSPLLFNLCPAQMEVYDELSIDEAANTLNDCLPNTSLNIRNIETIFIDALVQSMGDVVQCGDDEDKWPDVPRRSRTTHRSRHRHRTPVPSPRRRAERVRSSYFEHLYVKESWCGLPLEEFTNVACNEWMAKGITDDFYVQRYDAAHVAKMETLQELIDKNVTEELAVTRQSFDITWFSSMTNCIVNYRGKYRRAKAYGMYVNKEEGRRSTRHYIFYLCDYGDFVIATADGIFENFLYYTSYAIVSATPFQAVHCVLAGVYMRDADNPLITKSRKYLVCAMEEHCTAGSGAACQDLLEEHDMEIRSFTVLLYELEWLSDVWALKMLNVKYLLNHQALIEPRTVHFLVMNTDALQSEESLTRYAEEQLATGEEAYTADLELRNIVTGFFKQNLKDEDEDTDSLDMYEIDSDNCDTFVHYPQSSCPSPVTSEDSDMDEIYDHCFNNNTVVDYTEQFYDDDDDVVAMEDPDSTGSDDNKQQFDQQPASSTVQFDNGLSSGTVASADKPNEDCAENENIAVSTCEDDDVHGVNQSHLQEHLELDVPKDSASDEEHLQRSQCPGDILCSRIDDLKPIRTIAMAQFGLEGEDANVKSKDANEIALVENRGDADDKSIELNPIEDCKGKVNNSMNTAEEKNSGDEGKADSAKLEHCNELECDGGGGSGDCAIVPFNKSGDHIPIKRSEIDGGDHTDI